MLRLPAALLCAAAALTTTAAVAQQAAPPATAPAPAAPPESSVAEPDGIAEGVAAIVNDEIVSTYDLRQRMLLLIVSTGVRPTEQTLPQIEREALRSLVDERLQLQELKRRSEAAYNDSALQVDAELAALAQESNLTVEQLTGQLEAQGVRIQTLRDQLRAQVGWRSMIRQLYGRNVRIGDDQVKAELARLTATASKPQYLVGEIFIDASRVGGQAEALNGATQLITQMNGGAPFAAVARQFSAAPSAGTGGDAGWLTQGEIPPQLEAALAQMRPGQMSQPIPVQGGVYILLLRDKREGAGAPLVNLRQIAVRIPAGASDADVQAARTKLETLRPRVAGCADMEAKAATVQGAVAGDLGEAAVADLAPAFREAAQTLPEGQLSAPIRTSIGVHLVAVCGKRAAGANAPSSADVENRLYAQQLAMLSRRFLRDLRSEATIESR